MNRREGIQQAKEASEIFERLGDVTKQAEALINLAYVLHQDNQLDAAEEATSRALNLLPEQGEEFLVCSGHRALGGIYRSKGNTEKAIHHYEGALQIASFLNYHTELFWVHFVLADLFSSQGRFSDSHPHIECAKSHAVDDAYLLASMSWLQATFWAGQHMFEAKSEALCALNAFEKLGATDAAEHTRVLLGAIERGARGSELGPG